MKTMHNIKERPDRLLLFTAIISLFALVFPSLGNIDFQDKTMFSLPLVIMVWTIPLLLIAFWLLYLMTRRFLYSMTIARIHIFITVSATILMVTVLYIGFNPSQLTNDRHQFIGNAMQILFIIFVCGQFAYLANVLLGLFRRHKVQ